MSTKTPKDSIAVLLDFCKYLLIEWYAPKGMYWVPLLRLMDDAYSIINFYDRKDYRLLKKFCDKRDEKGIIETKINKLERALGSITDELDSILGNPCETKRKIEELLEILNDERGLWVASHWLTYLFDKFVNPDTVWAFRPLFYGLLLIYPSHRRNYEESPIRLTPDGIFVRIPDGELIGTIHVINDNGVLFKRIFAPHLELELDERAKNFFRASMKRLFLTLEMLAPYDMNFCKYLLDMYHKDAKCGVVALKLGAILDILFGLIELIREDKDIIKSIKDRIKKYREKQRSLDPLDHEKKEELNKEIRELEKKIKIFKEINKKVNKSVLLKPLPDDMIKEILRESSLILSQRLQASTVDKLCGFLKDNKVFGDKILWAALKDYFLQYDQALSLWSCEGRVNSENCFKKDFEPVIRFLEFHLGLEKCNNKAKKESIDPKVVDNEYYKVIRYLQFPMDRWNERFFSALIELKETKQVILSILDKCSSSADPKEKQKNLNEILRSREGRRWIVWKIAEKYDASPIYMDASYFIKDSLRVMGTGHFKKKRIEREVGEGIRKLIIILRRSKMDPYQLAKRLAKPI